MIAAYDKYANIMKTVDGAVTAQYNQKVGLGSGSLDGVEKSNKGAAKNVCSRKLLARMISETRGAPIYMFLARTPS